MAFELNEVVPWGRNLDEYVRMFRLSPADLSKKIAGFGDGPASFNAELSEKCGQVVSFDPIFRFSKDQLKQRIHETAETIIEQTVANRERFVWTNFKNVDELVTVRMDSMDRFLNDFELGIGEGRYQFHQLPNRTNYPDLYFDLGLSSHFLFLYDGLGTDFHIKSITEMLRICKEVRIFPLLNLNAIESEVLQPVINHFSSSFSVEIQEVDYEFQRGGNRMLSIERLFL